MPPPAIIKYARPSFGEQDTLRKINTFRYSEPSQTTPKINNFYARYVTMRSYFLMGSNE